MMYLIGSIFLFFLAWRSYKSKKLNDFRRTLQAGDKCCVFVAGIPYDAEVEDISGSVVYVVLSEEHVSFNNRFHITEIYPPLK